MRKLKLLPGFFLFVMFIMPASVAAANVNAASCSLADVQAAVSAAGDGDTVRIPSGQCLWSSGITMPTDRTLRIDGQGAGNTIIRTATVGMDLFTLGARGHSIGNMEIENGTINAFNSQGFRIHHIKFYCTTQKYAAVNSAMNSVYFPNMSWGVVDNCDFFNSRVLAAGAAAMLLENNVQHRLWALDAPLGDQHAIYVEDCTFDRDIMGNSVDGNYGGRYVFRYNYVKNSSCEAHSVQGNNRAIRTWEIYNNTFEGGSTYHWTAMFLRGGTGVVFGNVIKGYSSPIVLNNVRDTENAETSGQCDGTSPWDQNTQGEAGWRCRDQIGSGKDAALWEAGGAFRQESVPAYIWDNVDGNGNQASVQMQYPSTPNHIQENRDYYLSAKPGYTPYAYPHPFRTDCANYPLLCDTPQASDIIPADRRINWSAGIPGGIPARTNICANVKDAPYNAAGDGVADDTAAIQAALDACPQDSVVYLPEGTYRINAQLALVSKGLVIRGDGPDKTKILQANTTGMIRFVAWRSATITDVLSGFTRGSNQLVVADATNFNVGDYVFMDQLHDPALVSGFGCHYCSFWFPDNGTRTLGEGAVITAKSGNTLTLDRGLYFTFNITLQPRLRKVSDYPVRNAGVEDLYLERLVAGGGANILMQSCVNCWVKNIESNKCGNDHVRFNTCYRSEIRDSYIHHGYYFGGGGSYGLMLYDHNTNVLAENNIFYYLRHSMVLEAGGAGNVLAYSYSDRMFAEDYPNTDWLMADLSFHGSHPYMNLFEGNIGNHMSPDYTHGSSSHNTFFRNYIDMESQGEGRNITLHLIAADIQKYNRYINIVGNVFGKPGYTGAYEAENLTLCGNGTKLAYRLGYESDGDCRPSDNDPLVKATLLRHGNFDYITGATAWDPAISEHALPASLYLSSKPAFFGSLPWPAIGPDVSPMNGTIPAKLRFDQIMSGCDPVVPGDLNCDDTVDLADLVTVGIDFGRSSGLNNPNSDTNTDSIVDIFDVVFVASRYVFF